MPEYYKAELKKLADLSKREIPIKLVSFNLTESDSVTNFEKKWDTRTTKLDLSEQIKQTINTVIPHARTLLSFPCYDTGICYFRLSCQVLRCLCSKGVQQ